MATDNNAVSELEMLRGFILRSTRLTGLGDDEEIFSTGAVNSMFAMQLIFYLEKQFGIAIEDEDLHMDNFRTLNALLGLLARKQTRAPAVGS